MNEIRRARHIRTPSSRRMRKLVRELEVFHGRVLEADKPEQLKTDDRYRELYDLAPIGFYTLDHAARISELNERGAKLLGFATNWLLGKSFVVFIARQHVEPFLRFLMESTHALGTRVIELDMHVGTRTVPVQISVTTLGANRSAVHRLSVVDLTEFRKTEQLLEESLSNWHSLVHNAPDTIMTVESGGRICFVNKAVWGYSATALVGTNLLDHIPETSHARLLRCLEQSFRFSKRTMCEIALTDDGVVRWFNFSFGSPHFSKVSQHPDLTTTTTTTTTLMIREISEAKRTEESLRVSGEQLRHFAARLEAVREDERTRVAREIHDELGQALTVLKLDLAWAESKTRGAEVSDIRKKMKRMIAHVDNTIDRVRRISSELRPAILDDLGLIAAIEWQVSEFQKRTRIRTEVVFNADGLNFPMEASVAVFRVVQEALTNIMRHAKASKVRVQLDRISNTLRIAITDNGRGITPAEKTDLKSLGIVGMRERISRLGGEFNIFSEPGKGTRLDIIIPAQND
jgi:PAS domain S-box-containing protein